MDYRVIAVGALCLALVPAASLAGPTKAAPAHAAPAHARPAPVKVAPADEYFGRMKMSILGITNSIRDTGVREGFDPLNASKYYNGLALTENALEDWAQKYPQDSWIPRRAYDLSHEFWRMHTTEADAQAQRCRTLLFRQFSHNHWAVIARRETPTLVAPVTAAVQPAAGEPSKQQQ
jgi:hypothetical protein